MIIIINYGMGNLGSIANMLKKVKAESIISSDPDIIKKADKLILPGVGAFDSGMKNLNEFGLLPILEEKVIHEKIPILGLCLGMQLFARLSKEGTLNGLGWIDAEVVRFHFHQPNNQLKIPHMGWNNINIKQSNPIINELDSEETRFYFVHSYHYVCPDQKNVLATTFYGYEFPSIIVKGNIVGTQFHPEKSHKFGMKLLQNFAENFG